MGWFRHRNFRLARLCGIQSKVSQENFAKAWHQQGHQVETTRGLDEQICRGKPSPMKLPLIKGCGYDDRIGWSGHPVFSFILGLAPTIREIDFRSSKINEAGGFGERRRLGGALEHTTKFWPKAIEFTFLCSHVSSFSMWINHEFWTTTESIVDQVADFVTTGMHEAVDATVSCCAAQGAGCENDKFPVLENWNHNR